MRAFKKTWKNRTESEYLTTNIHFKTDAAFKKKLNLAAKLANDTLSHFMREGMSNHITATLSKHSVKDPSRSNKKTQMILREILKLD